MDQNGTKTQTGNVSTETNHSSQPVKYPSHQQLQDEVAKIRLRPLNEGYNLLNKLVTVEKEEQSR